MPSSSKISIFTPSGASCCAARRAARLKDPLRRLPAMPRIVRELLISGHLFRNLKNSDRAKHTLFLDSSVMQAVHTIQPRGEGDDFAQASVGDTIRIKWSDMVKGASGKRISAYDRWCSFGLPRGTFSQQTLRRFASPARDGTRGRQSRTRRRCVAKVREDCGT